MGRKPNAIISEFFHRGQKLPDSSNRYEHTCKFCGERFPKGRTDTLIGHLLKRCQAVAATDKDRIHAFMSAKPDAHDSKVTKANNARKRGQIPGPSSGPAVSNLQNTSGLNGLNVLAEASRRVGGAPGASDHHGNVLGLHAGERSVVVDPALEHSTRFDVGEDSHAASAPSSPLSTQLFSTSAESHSPAHVVSNNPFFTTDISNDARQSSRLSLIAASANEIVTEDTDGPLVPTTSETNLEHNLTVPPQPRSHPYIRPLVTSSNIQLNEPYADSDGLVKTTKKPRSTFSEERRKEVRVVRKVGACLRCRMLKKTCSAGTPCGQCQSLQNPRVWMEYCVRARLMNQLESYSVGLHSTLAYHDIRSIKSQVQFEHSAGRIEAMHFESANLNFLTFGALYGPKQSVHNLDLVHDEEFDGVMDYVHILDGEMEEISAKLQVYVKSIPQHFFEAEQCNFVKKTLLLASELGKKYQDEMLNAALELWITTSILVDPLLNWTLYLNPTLPPTILQPLTTNTNESRIPVNTTSDVESYSLISAQLRSAAEKRAAKVSKMMLGKYEQRLLQRQRAGGFRTFLATLILLNCVERMSWLFRSWNCDNYIQRWPLERQPVYFVTQIEKFAEIVATHLKMRSLAPAFSINPDYTLKAKEGSEEDVCRWFDEVSLNYQTLQTRQLAEFDANDSRSLDLRYASVIVLSAETNAE